MVQTQAYRFYSVLVILTCLSSGGCALGVMASKMILGDPKVTSDFAAQTGFKLEESEKTLLVLCTAPHQVKAESPSIEYDIIDGVTRRLKVANVQVVKPDDVANWMDENGPWEDLTEVAVPLKADYVAHLDLTMMSYREENSPDLYRGRALGNIVVYEIDKSQEPAMALEVMRREFTSKYPFGPVSTDNMSAEIFKRDYLNRVCDQMAMKFYDHKMAAEID